MRYRSRLLQKASVVAVVGLVTTNQTNDDVKQSLMDEELVEEILVLIP